MLRPIAFACAVLAVLSARRAELPTAGANDNTSSGGVSRNGTLAIALEAHRSIWHPDGDSLQGREVAAFSEVGKKPQIPGPLIRVPAGTPVELTIRNTDVGDTLRFVIPRAVRGAGPGFDTTIVAPGERRDVRFTAAQPGNFHYRAMTRDPLSRALQMHGLLGGAIVVDSAAVRGRPRDRVFVMLWSVDSLAPVGSQNFFNMARVQNEQLHFARSIFSINGRNWPHTERLSANVGDSLRWRVINLSDDIHPMHLHGFFFRVDDYWSPTPPADGQEVRGRLAVTERLPSFATMTMTWAPERAGNWLFHCHFAVHVLPLHLVQGGAARFFAPPPATHSSHGVHASHAATAMSGLVMGVEVRPRSGRVVNDVAPGRRQLRLVAVQDSAYPEDAPSMRFRVEEPARASTVETPAGASPPLFLRRGEPVSINIRNTMREETAVHWHGMELESYYDGVAGFGGFGRRLAPVIAPGDSFEARFTPPRSGTFIYHSHVNEPRQHRAGLLGALIVADSLPTSNEVLVLLKAPRAYILGSPSMEINGQTNPDTVVLRANQPARIRMISLTYVSPNATVWLTARPDSSGPNLRDTMVVQWRPIAKDGADLPVTQRKPRLARQLISMGETYDFAFTPEQTGHYRIEVRSAAPTGRLLARVPLRVQ